MELALFPPQALDSSVITTVWIGLCVVSFFNLRFGTTMAGIVVPGYLVPLLLVKPISAVVILGQAIVTYLLVRLVADRWMRKADATELFGRDRYFAILLMSVLVRIAGDLWLLPELGGWLGAHGIVFDWRDNLHSFGLIIVALTASQFWNGGLRLGLGYFGLYLATTWLIVRFVLVPFTNFDISSLHFVYENIASNVLDSPKAYMIILATAFFASRLNLNFGWDFSGIMVPALIALLWYEPHRLASTLLETFIVYAMGRQALRLPVFRRMNMEGARLLLLFATVAYAYKMLIGFLFGMFSPQYKPSDFFAFGYLVSTLLAVKMHGKQLTWQLASTTVSASIMGVVIGNAVGFAIVLAGSQAAPQAMAQTIEESMPPEDLRDRVTQLERTMYRMQAPTPDRDRIRMSAPLMDAMASMMQLRGEADATKIDALAASLKPQGLALERHGDWLLMVDRLPGRGGGLYAVNLRPSTGMAISVPAPFDEPGTLQAGMRLAISGDHALFLAGGMRMNRLRGGLSDPFANPSLPYVRAHTLAEEGVAIIRGRRMRGGKTPDVELWVQGALPAGMSGAWLGRELGPHAIRWGVRREQDALRMAIRVPYTEMLLSSTMRLRLMARDRGAEAYRAVVSAQTIEGFLFEWLVARKDALAPAGSERPAAPSMSDLLYFQNEVIPAAIALTRQWDPSRPDPESARALAASAAGLGFETILFTQRDTRDTHLILTDRRQASRHMGTYVFRLGEHSERSIEVPRPLEDLGTFEYGAALYAELRARSLLVSGAHSMARADGKADVLAPGNSRTMFNAAHQALLLRTPSEWLLQVRALGAGSADANDVTIAFAGQPPARTERHRAIALVGELRRPDARVATAGADDTDGTPLSPSDPQANAARRLPQHRFMTLWLSPQLRRSFQSPLSRDTDAALFADLGIPTVKLPLTDALADWDRLVPMPLPTSVRQTADAFVAERNLQLLHALQRKGWTLRRFIDPATGDALLEIGDANGHRGIRNLDSAARRTLALAPDPQTHARTLARFLSGRHAWLVPAANQGRSG